MSHSAGGHIKVKRLEITTVCQIYHLLNMHASYEKASAWNLEHMYRGIVISPFGNNVKHLASYIHLFIGHIMIHIKSQTYL